MFRCFNGSLLSITIGFTDERVARIVCTRRSADDVLAARLADYSSCSSIQILPVFTADTSRQGASNVIHRGRTIIDVAMVTEGTGNPIGITARSSSFAATLFFPTKRLYSRDSKSRSLLLIRAIILGHLQSFVCLRVWHELKKTCFD